MQTSNITMFCHHFYNLCSCTIIIKALLLTLNGKERSILTFWLHQKLDRGKSLGEQSPLCIASLRPGWSFQRDNCLFSVRQKHRVRGAITSQMYIIKATELVKISPTQWWYQAHDFVLNLEIVCRYWCCRYIWIRRNWTWEMFTLSELLWA